MTLQVALTHRFPGLSLDVGFEAGGVTALFGASGAGKTTVANAVAGLLRPQGGQIVLNGRILSGPRIWVPPHRRRIGYVFQEARLFPHLSVRANLLYGARGADGLADVVDLLGMGALLDRRPARLSGGERQRVAIGRALLSRPALLIMDEPLSALDARRKDDILPYLEALAAREVPILYVSHSLTEIVRLADRVVLMEGGRVTGCGTPADLVADPALAPLLGPRQSGAVLDGRIEVVEPDGLARIATRAGSLLLPADGAARLTLRIRIMAEDVLISRAAPQGLSALNVLPAVVEDVLPDGATALVRLRLAGDVPLLARITLRSAGTLSLAPGLAVHAVIKTAALLGQG